MEEFRGFLEADEKTFPDNRLRVDNLMAAGDKVASWARYSGTQEGPSGPFPPSGKRMECEFAGVCTIKDGIICGGRLTWDNQSVLAQLGHIPVPGWEDQGVATMPVCGEHPGQQVAVQQAEESVRPSRGHGRCCATSS